MIRNQLTGGDLSDEMQASILRDNAEKLLNEDQPKPKPKRTTH
jgi:hypothetical protein